MTVVFEPGSLIADTEAHRRRLRFDLQFIEQIYKIRVRTIVENDEAGINRRPLAIEIHIDCIRMAADVVVRFEHRDATRRVQAIRRDEPRNARPDYGHVHRVLSTRQSVIQRPVQRSLLRAKNR